MSVFIYLVMPLGMTVLPPANILAVAGMPLARVFFMAVVIALHSLCSDGRIIWPSGHRWRF
ncbi:MAG: hypothetical protein BZY80_05670 [SAR202 cluster bacterium Io17-Chloro-G2]|nr:MAG: hypothetical protein BZY80_05670 [SAR202 cluster bacterium Io17-Chloro-G2]